MHRTVIIQVCLPSHFAVVSARIKWMFVYSDKHILLSLGDSHHSAFVDVALGEHG